MNAVVHWGWGDATSVMPLQHILLGAGLRPIAPDQSAPLYSVRRELSTRAPHRLTASSESMREQLATEE